MALKRQALLWGSLFLFIVAFVLHIHQVYTMAAALACLPLVAWFLGRHKLSGLQVERAQPHAITAGEPASVTLTVTNESRTRRHFFIIKETVPEALRAEGPIELPVAMLGPGEQTRLSYEVLPPRRGVYTLGPAILLAPDAIGLRQFGRNLEQTSELLVYPRPALLPYLWPSASGGRHPVRPRRRLRGVGEEFYGVRDYVSGDDPRHIDWKTSARRGKLAVVEYERPEALEAMILLDLDRRWHGGAGDRHTLEYAVTLAATLADQAYERGSTVGLIARGQADFEALPTSEADERLRLYGLLARVQADAELPLPQSLAACIQLLPPHSTIAVISPSPQAGVVAPYLRGLGHAVAWFALAAPSFDARLRADYSEVARACAGARVPLRTISGEAPLTTAWEGRRALS